MSKTIKLFNGRANETQDAEISHINGEWVATFADDHFVKFGFTEDMSELRAQIDNFNKVNKPVVTTEMLEKTQADADALLEDL